MKREKSTVIYQNETVEGSSSLISKTNILPNISQLMLDFINCHENAERKLSIMSLSNLNVYNDP